MRSYLITITETLEKTIAVEADSVEAAIEKAEEMVNSEEIILTADNFTDRSFTVNI